MKKLKRYVIYLMLFLVEFVGLLLIATPSKADQVTVGQGNKIENSTYKNSANQNITLKSKNISNQNTEVKGGNNQVVSKQNTEVKGENNQVVPKQISSNKNSEPQVIIGQQQKENQNFTAIYGVKSDEWLKQGTSVDPAVNLKNFSNLDDLRNLDIIQDENDQEYFCLRRYVAYPKGGITYYVVENPTWVDPTDSTINGNLPEIEKKNKASISWLIKNYYESINGQDSSIGDIFNKENMETKYAATQLAIWTFSNPRTVNNPSYARIISSNDIIKDLIAEAGKQDSDKTLDYDDLSKKIDNVDASFGKITELGNNKDTYSYSVPVNASNVDSSLELSVKNNVKFTWIANDTARAAETDITNQIKYTIKGSEINGQLAIIEFEVPKEYIENGNGTLTMQADLQVKSKNGYVLYYSSFKGYQPIGYYGKVQKDLALYKKFDLGTLTELSEQKKFGKMKII